MIRLSDYLSSAQAADVATGAATIDCATALQSAINDAKGETVELPRGVIRINSQIVPAQFDTTADGQFMRGLKLAGPGAGICEIRSFVANDHAIKVQATTDFLFRRDIVFSGFRLNGEYVSAGNSGFYLEQAVNVLFDGCHIENFAKDGIYVKVAANDSKSSNNVILERCHIHNCHGWGFNLDPASGSNDLSFLTVKGTSFNSNGVSESKEISAIESFVDQTDNVKKTRITTAAAHGFVAGDNIYVFYAEGMPSINRTPLTVQSIAKSSTNAPYDVLVIALDSSGFGTHSIGTGFVLPRVPKSGSLKWRGQMCHLEDGFMTESKNAGLFIPDGPGGGFRMMADDFTIENTNGISMLVHGVDGMECRGLDLRSNGLNGTFKAFAHVFLDASVSVINNVRFQGCSLRTLLSSPQQVAFDAIVSPMLGSVAITGTAWEGFSTLDGRFGAGVFGALAPHIEDSGADGRVNRFTPSATAATRYPAKLGDPAVANPSYIPVVRCEDTHLIHLADASGTLTINNPDKGSLAGTAVEGKRLFFAIKNTTSNPIALALGWQFDAQDAPANIGANKRATAEFMWDSSVGWVRTRPWSTFG